MATPPKPPPPCAICTKPRKEECSHVECPNRRPITAQPTGMNQMRVPSRGRSVPKTHQE